MLNARAMPGTVSGTVSIPWTWTGARDRLLSRAWPIFISVGSGN
jgi:chromosome segregation ATPase